MADPRFEIVARLSRHFDVDRCIEDPAFVIDVYRNERIEAREEIVSLRRRLQEAGINTAADLPLDPKVVRLHA